MTDALATPSSFDDLIPATFDDEVTKAAAELASHIQSRFGPMADEAATLEVDIPSDPVALGIQQFNQKLSLLREHSNKLGGFLTQAIAELHTARARRDRARAAYDEKLTRTINNDEEIRSISGMEAKKHRAQEILSRERSIVTYAEQIYTLVSGYHQAIKQRHDQLKDTKSDLMSQLAVIKQQIALGETDPSKFPLDRGGVSPPRSRTAEIEQELTRELGPAGTVEL